MGISRHFAHQPFSLDAEIEQYLKSGTCQYGYNVDVVSYSNGRRHTHNSNDGKAKNCLGVVAQHAPVWQRFTKKRCSVRILHPQQQSEALWRVMARLEAELLCCVGWYVGGESVLRGLDLTDLVVIGSDCWNSSGHCRAQRATTYICSQHILCPNPWQQRVPDAERVAGVCPPL